jgi:xanthine dehydrogenase accessory factor
MNDNPVLAAVRHIVDSDEFGCRIVMVAGPDTFSSAVIDADGGYITGALPERIAGSLISDALTLMSVERTTTARYGDDEAFFEVLAPRPKLIVFGAVHVAQSLVPMAQMMGFEVAVSDARPAFITSERFPDADELLVGWPGDLGDGLVFDRRTFVVILSHDARYEDPLWPLVLNSEVRYIGAMGSRRTAKARRERLLNEGYPEEAVDRIHGPIGIDIGAVTPAEIAVSILAELTASRYGSGSQLDLVGEPQRLTKGEYL